MSVLFVSGAGLSSWVWDEVRADLAGHSATVVAPRDPSPAARVGDHARAALGAAEGERLLVVAHSAGGVIAQEMVRQAPGRIIGVLGLSAAFPAVGRSFATAMPFPQRVVLPLLLRLAGTRPPESAIRSGLTAGLPADVADRLVAEFATESRALFTDRVQPRPSQPPFGYVTTTADRELTPARQRRFADTVNAAWRQDLPTGHLPMLADPAAVAGMIRAFADEVCRSV
jgi:pimeloyl-ACP methyl ester carboxylesterase